MKLHVLVRVHVIERQASRAKCFELSPDLLPELSAYLRQQEKPYASAPKVPIEFAVAADEPPDLLVRQNGPTIDQDQMQADAELGQPAGARHCIGSGLAADHQARG
jgi:hypothetical protein